MRMYMEPERQSRRADEGRRRTWAPPAVVDCAQSSRLASLIAQAAGCNAAALGAESAAGAACNAAPTERALNYSEMGRMTVSAYDERDDDIGVEVRAGLATYDCTRLATYHMCIILCVHMLWLACMGPSALC